MKVVNVELQAIEATDKVQTSMNDIIISNQEKIAASNRANAVENEADGKRRAQIKEASGEADAIILKVCYFI